MRDPFEFERTSKSEEAIHSSCVIQGEVILEDGASIGPFCTIEGSVRIGAGTRILANSRINGSTIIGAHCTIGPHCVIGAAPQHHGYDGSETFVVIDDDVLIREFATVNRAMTPGVEHATHVGRGAMLMIGSHVGHDGRVGEYATLANAVQLGGHVTVGDRAFIGGGTVIHQFARVGKLAIVAGGEALAKDVMPYGAVFRDRHKGYNAVGCRRAGMEAAHVHALRAVFRRIHGARSAAAAVRQLRADGWDDSIPAVRELLEFIETSVRGIQPSARSAEEEHGGEEARGEHQAPRMKRVERWGKERVVG